MALESEPQSTPLGGSNLDDLKSESSNNVDLEDGEIDDDDDDGAVLAVNAAPAPSPAPAPPPVSGPSAPRAPSVSKGQDGGRREQRENTSLPPWIQRRLGPTPPKLKKNSGKGSWGPPHKNNFVPEEDEDDFVKDLEKALQAKAREKAKQASKEKSMEEREGKDDGNSEDDDDHGKKRKKRKRSKDGEGERERDSKRKRKDGEGDEDDMIFVRGASPQQDAPGSPTYRNYDQDRSYDSYGEEEDDFDGSPDRAGPGGFPSRGRGRGSKVMRGGSRGRGRMTALMESGRGGFLNKRGSKRGKLQQQQRPGRERTQDTICMYYMQGKCPKEADECPFSHDAMPRRKMELCKFYNMNCCAKREKCLYMHKDFPCKYFHTGRKCNSGDKCRYSHDPLSDVTRGVLLKHIELAPKEILGEFRRLTREQAIQIIDRAAKLRTEGKNPEGIDLLRCNEEEHNDSGDDRAHTPMPSSPSDMLSNEPEMRRSRGDDGRRRDHHSERDRNRERNHSDWDDPPKNRKERRERRRKRRWDNPEDSPSQLMKLQETLQRQLKEEEDEVKSSEKRGNFKEMEGNSDFNAGADHSTKNSRSSHETSKDKASYSNNDHKNDFQQDSESPEARDESEILEKRDPADLSAGDTGDDSQDTSTSIPTHLPKRQQELFLRIQQQQREAEHNREKKAEDSEDDIGAAEDDWYSSDEDGPRSLTDVLKNLKDGQTDSGNEFRKQKDEESSRERKVPAPLSHADEKNKMDEPKDHEAKPGRRPPLLPTPNLLTNLVKNTDIDQLLSNIRYGPTGAILPNAAPTPASSTTTQPENPSTPAASASPSSAPTTAPALARDPRLSRDPRQRGNALGGTSSSPTASPSSHTAEARSDPRLEARIDPRSERRDPRTERGDSRAETVHGPMETLTSPRAEHRDYRTADPRAARADTRRTSESSSSQVQRSIYDNAPILSGAGDVDLRVRTVAHDSVGDTDFRRHNSQFGAGDMDMRRDLSSGALPTQDTDLRFRLGLAPRDIEGNYATTSQSDMDLRRMQMMLPFKPAPVHTPATEIDASLSSHTPGPYRVVRIDIPKPDFSHLKINPTDPQVKLDPRLRGVFGLNQSDPSEPTTPLSPPLETSQAAGSPPPVFPRSDPRRRNSNTNTSRPADPRQSRMGTGMGMMMAMGVGPGSVTCPPTPRADDFDGPLMVDTDLRMQAQYGRQPAPWENSCNRGRGLLPHPDSWMPNLPNTATSFGRAPSVQPHSYHPQRSYTPPPT